MNKHMENTKQYFYGPMRGMLNRKSTFTIFCLLFQEGKETRGNWLGKRDHWLLSRFLHIVQPGS